MKMLHTFLIVCLVMMVYLDFCEFKCKADEDETDEYDGIYVTQSPPILLAALCAALKQQGKTSNLCV
ncbi:hypothetical protein SNE40_014485 [Patella caerulea]|uniref:Uncharacterized protein n=1 Tax=Patella caerulea TaxID=87958 RepID=A0AAN8JDN4_PATCE